ncbi:dihydrolipoyllysine-residue acetyltransferase [Ferrimonas lipolytica]|uniref:Dihydrolipoamide acetyltransferase component of pyruvate dehydrogenase complex n=1 Tax=Ferrimonas lipolytica TaxID=2724191 RepID=A0A6H1UAS3_9GAMM|nr:dihydrolipoyllysine-residue acetyltransferase [Ferrimonas lipolytica]QIZ76165.1 dihydrolipoyllysine-residue acetyltransferase [Ferrimonas lipolytica]
MIKDFILPDIGEGVVECELVEWLVAEGDVIAEDQPIADVMTDKALVQIPAPYAGTITKLFYRKGQVAKVHAPLFQVELADASTAITEVAVEPPQAAAAKVIDDFILPDIGEGIVECELVEWLVAEGDVVEEDQPICDVMTDKALVQIPAKQQGTIHKLYYRKGQVAKVHQPLFALALPSSAAGAAAAPVEASSAATPDSMVQATAPVRHGKAVASPAVRRLAREHEVDLGLVSGTGKNGRIYKEDLHRYLESAQSDSAPLALPETMPIEAKRAAAEYVAGTDRVEPIKGIKAAMAKQMMASVQSIPHFTYCDELDLTELVALRQSLNAQYAEQGIKLSFMPFFIKALSLAMSQYPALNSRVNDAGDEQTFVHDHNIGIAVDGKLGLMVPNIKQVQVRSILEVGAEVGRLISAARDGRVAPADLQGGTISISNIGAIGGTVATPIINKPEVAIVALGKLQTLPRFNNDGEVEARTIMQISWSGDHRVIDGATIARFCNLWRSYLEQPQRMMMAMR